MNADNGVKVQGKNRKRREVMSKMTYGELNDWGDADLGGGGEYIKLEEGSNVVRIFTKPYQYYQAWIVDKTGKKRPVRSAVENCPLVQRGEDVKARWVVGVIQRGDKKDSSGILEIGPQVYRGIMGLKNKKNWGDPRGYDIDIVRGKPGTQPLYSVVPEGKAPLSDEDKTMAREFMDKVDLMKLVEPPTREQVLQELGESEKSGSDVDDSFDDMDDGLDDFDFTEA